MVLWRDPTTAVAEAALRAHEQAVREAGFDTWEPDATAARRAAVYTRQDVAQVIMWQGAMHVQLVNISRGIWALVIAAALIYGALAHSH